LLSLTDQPSSFLFLALVEQTPAYADESH